MQNHKDNFQRRDENAFFEVAVFSIIGDREEQQDSVGYEIKSNEGLVVICDGMGGHNGGKLAASLAVDVMIKRYAQEYQVVNFRDMLTDVVNESDEKIANLKDENGNPLNAGSTIVAVAVRGRTLYWISVGDSRIYLFRNGEFVQVTKDHIYQNLLDEKRENGLISDEEYRSRSLHGDALVSYLGLNGLSVIDANKNPFPLLKNDKVLLTTDGLYKLVSDEEIKRILSNFNNTEDALQALSLKAQRASKNLAVSRDNMTLALIRIK